MSHGKQLSYRKQQPATLLTNQKVPNPILVSKWKGCPPLPQQTPAELDHLLKYPLSATAVQQTLPSNHSHSTQISSWSGTKFSANFLPILHLFHFFPLFHIMSVIPVSQHERVNGRKNHPSMWTGQLPKQIVKDCTKLLIFFPLIAINLRIECGHKCKPRPHLLIEQSLCTCTTAVKCTQNT